MQRNATDRIVRIEVSSALKKGMIETYTRLSFSSGRSFQKKEKGLDIKFPEYSINQRVWTTFNEDGDVVSVSTI